MDFNSPLFLFLFLPVFMLIYHVASSRGKIVIGIIGSLLFYAWGNLKYIPLMLFILFLSYFIALGIERWRGRNIAPVLLWTGVIVIVAILVLFKAWSTIKYPLGLSYITFQAIAYLVEVYRKANSSQRNLLKLCFYLLMFPKILVGPITRYSQIHNQIENIEDEPEQFASGLRRFIGGLAKKTLIADTLAKVITPIFALSSPNISPAIAWLVIISYSLQLFYDFSGYTDMAIGLGRMMGLRFIENFDYPYLSKSISEFWRRWHISLSSWFRDMVFYPLERHRIKWLGQRFNILLVFVLTGLWHGLTINFVIWGLIHGLALVFESTFLGKKLRTFWSPVQHLYAMGLVLVGWVFFRSPTPGFALEFLYRLLGRTISLSVLPFDLTNPLPFIEPTFIVALILGIILLFPIQKIFDRLFQTPAPRPLTELGLRLAGDLVLVVLLILSIAAQTSSVYRPGIYGNF
jgi:alginate O-acetyltransferase complex protein AlgI